MKIDNPRDIFRRRLRRVIEIEIESRKDALCHETEGRSIPKINQSTIAEECGINYKTLNSYIREEGRGKSKGAFPRLDQLAQEKCTDV